jgi:hypothetical protein
LLARLLGSSPLLVSAEPVRSDWSASTLARLRRGHVPAPIIFAAARLFSATPPPNYRVQIVGIALLQCSGMCCR